MPAQRPLPRPLAQERRRGTPFLRLAFAILAAAGLHALSPAKAQATACDERTPRVELGTIHPSPDGWPSAVVQRRAGPVLVEGTAVNPSPEPSRFVLATWFPYLASVVLREAGSGETPRRAGSLHPAGAGGVLSPVPAFPLDLGGGEARPLALCIAHRGPIIAPILLLRESDFAGRVLRDLLISAVCLGIVLAAVLHAAASWALLGQRVFGWLTAFCGVAAGAILVASGFGKAVLWPATGYDAAATFAVLQGVLLASGAQLLKVVLFPHRSRARLARLFDLVAFAAAGSAVGAPIDGGIAFAFAAFSTVLGPILVLGALAVLALRGVRRARLALFGWGLGQAATIHLALRLLDVTPYHPINHHLVALATVAVVSAFATIAAGMAAESRWQSLTDELTGLANRRNFAERLAETLRKAERTGEPVSIALLDLDRFKSINDRFGHDAGDEVLRQVAAALRERLRRSDCLARLGGEEFALLIPDAHEATALALVERLRSAVADTPLAALGGERTTVSCGVAQWRPGETAKEVLGRADRALYAAKRQGRNRTVAASELPEPQ